RPLLNRSWSSTIRTRTSSSASWSALAGVLIPRCPSGPRGRESLVKGDRNRAPSPGERVGNRWEPEVDRVAGHGAPRVGGNALAVAGDRQARSQGDHSRV